jgi:hypothetical protein
MNESFQYALTALMMAIIFIYMILGSQFKSFLQPLALMTSLPLTLIGVVLALMTIQVDSVHVLRHWRGDAHGLGHQKCHFVGRFCHPST